MTTSWTARIRGRRIRLHDHGGSGVPVVAIHGTFGTGRTFDVLRDCTPGVRVLSYDQRGHGDSDHGGRFDRAAYLADAVGVLEHLDLGPVVLLGHSLGGVTAMQLARRRPDLVAKLIVADIGAVTDESVVAQPVVDVTGWPLTWPSAAAAARFLTDAGVPHAEYFLQSLRHRGTSVSFAFRYHEMMATQRGNVGVWWDDWLGSRQRALLLRGEHSFMLPAALGVEMACRRPQTRIHLLAGCGHWAHLDDPYAFGSAIAAFATESA